MDKRNQPDPGHFLIIGVLASVIILAVALLIASRLNLSGSGASGLRDQIKQALGLVRASPSSTAGLTGGTVPVEREEPKRVVSIAESRDSIDLPNGRLSKDMVLLKATLMLPTASWMGPCEKIEIRGRERRNCEGFASLHRLPEGRDLLVVYRRPSESSGSADSGLAPPLLVAEIHLIAAGSDASNKKTKANP